MVILRSVVAVVAGIAVFSLLLVGASAAGNALLGGDTEWINRSLTTRVVWLIWNVTSMVVGGYVAARIASRAPDTHAVIMGTIQSLFTLGAMLTLTENITPPWQWIAAILTTIPAAWAGARLRRARLRAR